MCSVVLPDICGWLYVIDSYKDGCQHADCNIKFFIRTQPRSVRSQPNKACSRLLQWAASARVVVLPTCSHEIVPVVKFLGGIFSHTKLCKDRRVSSAVCQSIRALDFIGVHVHVDRH